MSCVEFLQQQGGEWPRWIHFAVRLHYIPLQLRCSPRMSATTQIRLASLSCAAYGALLVSGTVYHFQHTGSFRALAASRTQTVPLRLLRWVSSHASLARWVEAIAAR